MSMIISTTPLPLQGRQDKLYVTCHYYNSQIHWISRDTCGHKPLLHLNQLTAFASNIDHFHVLGRVISLNVWINSLLDHSLAQLSSSQLAPDGWLITLLRKLICTIQIVDVINQNLSHKQQTHQVNTNMQVSKYKQGQKTSQKW